MTRRTVATLMSDASARPGLLPSRANLARICVGRETPPWVRTRSFRNLPIILEGQGPGMRAHKRLGHRQAGGKPQPEFAAFSPRSPNCSFKQLYLRWTPKPGQGPMSTLLSPIRHSHRGLRGLRHGAGRPPGERGPGGEKKFLSRSKKRLAIALRLGVYKISNQHL